jgi:hypothetical protein
MVKYENAKIYKLINRQNGSVYIGGSTKTDKLEQRRSEHFNRYKRYLKLPTLAERCKAYCPSFSLFEDSDDYNHIIDVELIVECPCENKKQLNDNIAMYINEMDCVNKEKPKELIDRKEAYENKYKIWHKSHYEKNKDKIRAYQKARYDKLKEKCIKTQLENIREHLTNDDKKELLIKIDDIYTEYFGEKI